MVAPRGCWRRGCVYACADSMVGVDEARGKRTVGRGAMVAALYHISGAVRFIRRGVGSKPKLVIWLLRWWWLLHSTIKSERSAPPMQGRWQAYKSTFQTPLGRCVKTCSTTSQEYLNTKLRLLHISPRSLHNNFVA